MSLKQANSGTVYPEPAGASLGPVVTPFTLELSGGALIPTPNGAIDARLLDAGSNKYVVTDGGDNPTNAAELRMAAAGSVITIYQ